jgi:plasmid stabilization system protein ParE
MKRNKLRIHLDAQLEIEEAFERYRQEGIRIAAPFLDQIARSFDRILANPKLYPPYTRNTRRRILGSFPYSVIYQERDETILIVAVAHAKRREGNWRKRTR